jgi:type IV pilus assembly protein PilV
MEKPAMRLNVLRNSRGFTLIEVLVGLVVLLLGLLGALVGVVAVADHNLMNNLRNEAIKLAQEEMENTRNESYAGLVSGSFDLPTVQRDFRKGQVAFQVRREISTSASTSLVKKIGITVRWVYRGATHSYVLESIIKGPQ